MKEYLPLGTVVVLKNGQKKIMIYGRKQISIKTKVEYDYIACLYPEGNINNDYRYLFNNEDIEKVFFRGYSDTEEERFLDLLNKPKI